MLSTKVKLLVENTSCRFGLAVSYNLFGSCPADQVTRGVNQIVTNCVSFPQAASHFCNPSVCAVFCWTVSSSACQQALGGGTQHDQNHGILYSPFTQSLVANVTFVCACSLCRSFIFSRPLKESPNIATTMAPFACPLLALYLPCTRPAHTLRLPSTCQCESYV